MVDVGDKNPTKRSATASGRIYVTALAYDLVTKTYPERGDRHEGALTPEQRAADKARRKGDTLTIAQLAAIMGAKQTSNLIPLCHPLALTKIDVNLKPQIEETRGADSDTRKYFIQCEATVSCEGKTGVEMEALSAVSVGLLTVWDMLKAVAGRQMEITNIKVTVKSGGKSGDFIRS